MKITFLGAAETVTGSCYLVETDQTSFLVDCGMHQGHLHEEQMNRAPFPFRMDNIDFVLLTHAHIDHSGRIPKLYVDGYRNPVYATQATCDLCQIMLPDSGHIQEMEEEWQNRKNTRAGKPVDKAIYTMDDAVKSCSLFKPLKYNATFNPASDVRVAFRDAGHILGSAILEIWVQEAGRESKIVFSGDLGNKNMPILRDPTIIDGADYLVLESTYGDRLHPNGTDKVERFVSVINETIARGGNVIIPSFAVGRTQEIIYALHSAGEKYQDQRMAFMQTPVYIDSPLAVSATRVFRENTDCYDDEARQYIANGDNPLDFPNLHFTRSVDESKLLNQSEESKIIISASGMCDAGRIKHHLKHNLWRPDSTILFVGYQAQGTLGRQIIDGAKIVKIFGEEIVIHAHIEANQGFSGHADRDGLLDWVAAMKQKPVQILLVHGEPEVINSFSASISQRLGLDTHIARLNETLTLGAPVEHGRLVPEKLRDPRLAKTTWVLDTLQADFISALERLKDDVGQAATKDELDTVLASLQTKLEQTTEQLLAGHRIPQ
ncbi:MAG: MBL fold metallo-hydrolase [Clostridiaceae bacterium]|nr:MBL fold metallo-hydrolase [Clostridiaceae bacterium]